jgi:hypothetical protein
MLGCDFEVREPPELVEQLARLAERYRRAVLAPAPEHAADGWRPRSGDTLARHHRGGCS